MKLAWPTNPAGSFNAAKTEQVSVEQLRHAFEMPAFKPVGTQSKASTNGFLKALAFVVDLFKKPESLSAQSFKTPEQKQRQEHIKLYAESPFEKTLFSLQKKNGEHTISSAWAKAIRGQDPVQREAALSLLTSYLSYSRMDGKDPLSSHTQMKLLLFSPHLNEGIVGKTLLYDAVLGLPLKQMMRFLPHIQQDFSAIPPMGQLLILKQLLRYLRANDPEETEQEDMAALKKIVKALVIAFYTGSHQDLETVLKQQERLWLGFLKVQPVEDSYQKELEEVEKRYRRRLRQLKKVRGLKTSEANEKRDRRMELVYDVVERELFLGLSDMELDPEHILLN